MAREVLLGRREWQLHSYYLSQQAVAVTSSKQQSGGALMSLMLQPEAVPAQQR
ncbi:hypothetical protein J6590_101110 [Homalodisca vitripennis]|nr:hypothetical protein J6590_101110 [Homalodisca vitripennis]